MNSDLEGSWSRSTKVIINVSQTAHRKAGSLASLLASWQSVTEGGSIEPLKHPLAMYGSVS